MSATDTLRIAVSKASGSASYANYPLWLKAEGTEIEIIDLMNSDPALIGIQMETCDGLLLVGGPDVHPGRFDKEEDTARCSIDLIRDSIEFKALDIALEQKLPVFGICRGLQLINVHQGGDLIIDIPGDTPSEVPHQQDSGDAIHPVYIEKKSELFKVMKESESPVNSNHHQAIGMLAPSLKASAKSADGIVEGIEWKDKKDNWLMGVQWHPERLASNPQASSALSEKFISEVKKSKSQKKRKQK